MAAKYTRVLVHLRKTKQNVYEAAKFSECIFDHLGIEDDGFVECSLKDNQLLIQPPTTDNKSTVKYMGKSHSPTSYRIMHPPFCPVHHLDEESIKSLPPEIISRGVDVGVAVLLESSDRHLLLTRRAPHMRTFPGVWVPPGGHVEEGETLEEAALRELKEETGLSIDSSDSENSSILGLWESVYPPILAMGHPKRHHIVVYLHIITRYTAKDLISYFKLCPEEVDAAVWLSPDLVNVAVWNAGDKVEDEATVITSDENKEIHVTLVNKFGEHASGVLDSNILLNRVPSPGADIERISTGSRFALSLWLEKQFSSSKEAKIGNLYDKNIFLDKNSSERLKNKM